MTCMKPMPRAFCLTVLLAAMPTAALATADEAQPQPETKAAESAEPAGRRPRPTDADTPPRPKPQVRERDLGPPVRREIHPDGTSTIVEESFLAPAKEMPERPQTDTSHPPLTRAEFANDTKEADLPLAESRSLLADPTVLVAAGVVIVLLAVLIVAVRGRSQIPPTNPE
jgi:hypothetical protein